MYTVHFIIHRKKYYFWCFLFLSLFGFLSPQISIQRRLRFAAAMHNRQICSNCVMLQLRVSMYQNL